MIQPGFWLTHQSGTMKNDVMMDNASLESNSQSSGRMNTARGLMSPSLQIWPLPHAAAVGAPRFPAAA
jgi:hypothetical protein